MGKKRRSAKSCFFVFFPSSFVFIFLLIFHLIYVSSFSYSVLFVSRIIVGLINQFLLNFFPYLPRAPLG
ncbi:hypothetical protein L873DRAFT_446048 [Choiromyces venosus 120613-1]|uniref:Uncharacterized protein n=1 Tax=Choiromyces venosus 120613-1 TaxID=1336337 RepID=A0A3N4K1H4_9PEZI|nr:hypothetical protein L873DRAFT_446048 [Choiromyces venosus 120613-1]